MLLGFEWQAGVTVIRMFASTHARIEEAYEMIKPRVVLLGDSIRMAYEPFVRELLSGRRRPTTGSIRRTN